MDTVTIDIDITKPKGRKLMRNLVEYERCVRVRNTEAISKKKWYTLEEVEKKCLDRLSELYSVDIRALIKTHKL